MKRFRDLQRQDESIKKKPNWAFIATQKYLEKYKCVTLRSLQEKKKQFYR
jgi:hypothetical protein